MTTIERGIPVEIFKFSGQSDIETWSIREIFEEAGLNGYSKWLVDEWVLCFQRIRELANQFPFWQHRKWTGRRPISERDLFIGFILKEFFNATFRQTMGLMIILKEYYQFKNVPHHTVLSKKNRSRRWQIIWKRFHKYVLKLLPKRKAIIATDATGYSNRKTHWNDVKHEIKANQNWVKLHACIEVDNFLILNYTMTKSKVHDSNMFGSLWENLPENVKPIRSLADKAYHGNKCLNAAKAKGAVPIHGIKENAIHKRYPETAYQKMVNFGIHWPNRYKKLYGKRNHAETAFSMIGAHFGHRIRSRSKLGRKNEIQIKINAHNIRILTAMEWFQNSYV